MPRNPAKRGCCGQAMNHLSNDCRNDETMTKEKDSPGVQIYDPTKPFNGLIRELIRLTHAAHGPIEVSPQGKRFKINIDPIFCNGKCWLSGTDGIGTKGALHWEMGTIRSGVQDAFAMVVDDLIEGGFIPAMLQNHIIMQGEDNVRIFEAVDGLVSLCIDNPWTDGRHSYPIAVTGGETAILNTVQGFEMGITATGFAKIGHEIGAAVRSGDVLLGIQSSGIHSNGLSFYRDELLSKTGMKLADKAPWLDPKLGLTVGEELTRPTRVYLPAVKAMIEALDKAGISKPGTAIHGMVHITGGGLSKLRELSKSNVDIAIRRDHPLTPQDIFKYAYHELGTTSEKMYTRFNNGIGYTIAVSPEFEELVLGTVGAYFPTHRIGEVTKGRGRVIVESQYDSTTLLYR